ncbi:RNA methyltransferase [Rhodospirillum centenum]|uniref:tRNA (cytidine/uridine-2'-O-)-methyltransferase TrmJ n=1 Tax=Rhodospirillum centenum (strain ATCC 51521 / SW) TaxID=414684 RepID=B6ISG6_RHOCS|nr:RNA methyltransferase [Rhodospirillum centenum]ACI98402.1 RNA methyltransferase, TrmH family, group 1 [Rhodospirillum centenum SW]
MSSGTNRPELAKSQAALNAQGGPVVILVEPQMGENIGACARAMLNCGLTELRLVNPRDGWPNEKAVAASAGATEVLDRARVFTGTREAIADLHKVYATAARVRDMVKDIVTPRRAARDLHAHVAAGRRVGILFGPERTGLVNDDIVLSDTMISVPLNPGFSSLNLAQAVLLVAYEWWMEAAQAEEFYTHTGQSPPATKEELHNLFDHLEGELDQTGFYTHPDKKPSMVRNVRNTLQRAHMTEQEVRTFHGIIAALVGRKKQRARTE